GRGSARLPAPPRLAGLRHRPALRPAPARHHRSGDRRRHAGDDEGGHRPRRLRTRVHGLQVTGAGATVTLEWESEAVARLTLDRPDAANSINAVLAADLYAAAREVRFSGRAKAAIVT